MPRTRAQRRATEGLFALGDDALRNVLTLLTPSACALGPGATSRALRELTTSKLLQAARKAGSYTLRPPDHGVVHALATAMGTRRWATRSVRRHQFDREDSAGFANAAAVPPSRLRIIARRQSNHATTENHEDDEEPYASFFASLIVSSQSIRCDGGRECGLDAGSYIGYEIPFSLRLSHFRLSIGRCGYYSFRDWSFQAFDSEQREWRRLFSCEENLWADMPYAANWVPRAMTFPVNYDGLPFPAARFRIMLEARNCMHVRGLELFGTLLPGWSLD